MNVVEANGEVVRRCDHSQTSDVAQTRYPRSLAATKNGDIFVADSDNDRILLIDSSVSSAEELTLAVDDGIQDLCGLCADESRGRLYVEEWGRKCRVLMVFDVSL